MSVQLGGRITLLNAAEPMLKWDTRNDSKKEHALFIERFVFKKIICFAVLGTCLFLFASPQNAFAIDISQTPTEVMLQPNPPNFMITLDNSGSMAFETLAPGVAQGYFQIKIVDPNSDKSNFLF